MQTYTMQYAAKLLNIGSKTLFERLREDHILNQYNLPYQQYINLGYFQVLWRQHEQNNGAIKHYGRTIVTEPGLKWLDSRYNNTEAVNTNDIPAELHNALKNLLSAASKLIIAEQTGLAHEVGDIAGHIEAVKHKFTRNAGAASCAFSIKS